MDLPIFPVIEVTKNDDDLVENPLLEAFLQQFNVQLMNEISEMKISCENLKKSNENLQASKDKYLREIFILTHGNVSDEILPQRLTQRMQNELGMFRMGGQRVDEMLLSFQRDYKEWRGTLEEKKLAFLGNDDLIELTHSELKAKLESLSVDGENAKKELNAFEEITKVNNELLEKDIEKLNEELKTLESLKLEMDATQQRLIDELKEKQLKKQQDTNKLLKEIDYLQKNLELTE